jgi:nicotinamidase-related amidase
MKKIMRPKLIFSILLMIPLATHSINGQDKTKVSMNKIKISTEKRIPSNLDKGVYVIENEIQWWNPSETAIIICDMWDHHWCNSAAERVAEMAPFLNNVVSIARAKGVLIVHSPSECMEFYKNHPSRILGQKFKNNEVKHLINTDKLVTEKDAIWPIDQSESCDAEIHDKEAPPWPWTRQIDLIKISDTDAISDSGIEIAGLFQAKGIKNVILLGVHENFCIIGRPFGLRNMVRLGMNVVLMRDMTDSMYNPKQWPNVSHFDGTRLVCEYIEKYVCPTILSSDFTGQKQFRFKDDNGH